MPLTEEFLEETKTAIRLAKVSKARDLSAPLVEKMPCDLLGRQLEVQLQILESLERIEEKLK